MLKWVAKSLPQGKQMMCLRETPERGVHSSKNRKLNVMGTADGVAG